MSEDVIKLSFPNRVDSWIDWISPAMIHQTMVNVTTPLMWDYFLSFFVYQVKIVRFILKVSTLYSTSLMIWDVPKVYYFIPIFWAVVIVKFTLARPTNYNFKHTKSMQWIKWADLAVMSFTTGAQVHDPCFWKALPMLELTLRVEGSTL